MAAEWDQEAAVRRYFDNAATSFPKPPGVIDAVCEYMRGVGASAGRGAYREAVESQRLLGDVRDAVRELFACGPDDDVVFTLNGSDALNMGLKGLVEPGDHVVTTWLDHNSVLRPLSALAERIGISWTAVRGDPETTIVSANAIREALRVNTKLVALNHASNVTGTLQPLEEIAAVCAERGVRLLVDAAQSAGHVPISFRDTPIDALATPGHKGLLGPLGTGVLVLRAGLAERMTTLREGGTGSVSEQPVQPERMPDKFEPGSHNASGLAGLLASLRWIAERGVGALRAHEMELCARMMEGLDTIGVAWFGPRMVERRVGVFSVRVAGWSPAALSARLESQFGLLTRSGLHCAPFAHKQIGTDTRGGTTRFSLGPLLSAADVDAAVAGLAALLNSPVSAGA